MAHYVLERKAAGANHSRGERRDDADLHRDADAIGVDTAGYLTRGAAEQAARQIEVVSDNPYAVRVVRVVR